MKRSIFLAWGLLAVVFLLAVLGIWQRGADVQTREQSWTAPDPGASDSAIVLRVKLGDTVQEMDMDNYLQGVLRAEMPASFAIEALKAQAVAARTETVYKMEHGPAANHPDADICDNINCCQAYKAEEDARAAWGDAAEDYLAKIVTAVRETDGTVILYDNQPILAVFFSAASGQTNQAGEVWMNDLPYLQSVQSPEGADEVPNYYSVASFTEEEFRRIFLAAFPAADLSGAAADWFGVMDCTDSGMVRTLEVGGISVKGTKLRTLFSLRSAAFTVAAEDGEIVFRVTGYGHGVGMSQYGANVLAQAGKSYAEILQWYYTDVTLGAFTPKTLASGG